MEIFVGIFSSGFPREDLIFDDMHTHREISSKSYSINPNSDCIYHFPIDLEPNGQCPFAVPNQLENGKYNLISV